MYTRKKDTELATSLSTTGISDVIGGMASFILNYFKMKFPEDTFKETHVAESINANVLENGLAHNQKLPFLGMEIVFMDEPSVMGDTGRQHYPQRYVANFNRNTYYQPIFKDVDEKVTIYTMPTRLRVTFNFLMKFQTHIAAIDWLHYVNNHFEPEGANYVNNIRLPIELPKYFTDRIAKQKGFDLNTVEGIQDMESYLRLNSLGGFRYITNTTTGNKAFIHEYVTNVLLQYPDRAEIDTEEAGMVVKSSSVNFSIIAEVNSPSGFLLEVRDGSILPIAPRKEIDYNSHKMDFYVITDKIPNEFEGKRLIDKREFIAEINNSVDELDVSQILPKDLRNTIEAMSKINTFNMDLAFKYKLYAGTKPVPDDHFEVDFSSHHLVNHRPLANVTYTLALYGNLELLNQINDLILDNNRHRIKPLLDEFMNP